MGLTSNDIVLGSGSLYYYPMNTNSWSEYMNGNIPDNTIEQEQWRLGHVKGGATLTYEPTMLEVKDDMGLVGYTGMQEENCSFKSGVLTWTPNTLNIVSTTGNVSVDGNRSTLSVGGISHYAQPDALCRFVHQSNVRRLDFKPQISSGYEIAFQPSAETVIDLTFNCSPIPGSDGTLYKYMYDNTVS